MLHGFETWTMRKEDIKRLEDQDIGGFQDANMAKNGGVSWMDEEILEMVNKKRSLPDRNNKKPI